MMTLEDEFGEWPKITILGMVCSDDVIAPSRGQRYRDWVRCSALERMGWEVSTIDDKRGAHQQDGDHLPANKHDYHETPVEGDRLDARRRSKCFDSASLSRVCVISFVYTVQHIKKGAQEKIMQLILILAVIFAKRFIFGHLTLLGSDHCWVAAR